MSVTLNETIITDQLFDPRLYRGSFLGSLPRPIPERATQAAQAKLSAMPRYDRQLDEERELIYLSGRNVWHETMGGMGVTITAKDVAWSGILDYFSQTLGANAYRFEDELMAIANRVAGNG